MKALGKFVIVKPHEEHAENIIFQIKRKIQSGTLVDKGNDAQNILTKGDKVYYFAGMHNEFNDYLLLHTSNLQGVDTEFGFLPLGERVLIKPEPLEEETESGILINKKEDSIRWGELISHGPGIIGPALELTIGARTAYNKDAGTEILVDGDNFMIMPYDQLLLQESN